MKVGLIILALLIAGLSQWVSKEVNFVLIAGAVLLIFPHDKAAAYKKSFPLLWPILVLSLIGFLAGLTNLRDINRDFYRDTFLFLGNIVYFLSGVLLSKYIKDTNSFLKYFTLFVVASSILHLWLVFTNFSQISSLHQYRKVTGMTNMNEAIYLSFIVASFINKDLGRIIQLDFVTKALTSVILVSFLLYLSRTMIITLLVLTFFLSDCINVRSFFSTKNRRLPYIAFIVVLLLYSSSLVIPLLPSKSYAATLMGKFERIPDEVFWNSKDNYAAVLADINDNWRGYEAAQGLKKFSKGNDLRKVFGYGFGEVIDLEIIIKLANKDYEKVPIIHNGYVFLLVKCGITGLLLYLLFLYNVGFVKVKDFITQDSELPYLYQTLSGLSVVILLNTFTITGLFNPENASVVIIIGLFWGLIKRKELYISKKPEFKPLTRTLF